MPPSNEEEKVGSEEASDKLTAPTSGGWSPRTGEYRVYRDPETDEVTKVEIEGQVFVPPTDE